MYNSKEKSVDKLSEFVQLIEQISLDVKQRLYLYDFSILFRGHSNKDYLLLPSIGRSIRPEATEQIQMTLLEKELIQRAQCEFPNEFPFELPPFMLLAKLQHYGIPTRLLDVTSSALVALFFACRNMDVDGEVIVFQPHDIYSGFDSTVNAISDTYRIHNGDNDMSYSLFFERARTQKYYFEPQLQYEKIDDEKRKELPAEKDARRLFHTYFVLPQQLTYRQRIQHSLFILFPNAPVDWIDGNPGIGDQIIAVEKDAEIVTQRIIIPREAKSQIVKDLSLFGMSESFLFPEDIDKGCSQISQVYRERLMRDELACHNAVG